MEIKSGNITAGSTHLRVPPVIEALQCEIRRHPKLVQELRLEEANGKVKTFEDALAIVAAYADITLHGVYGADEIEPIVANIVKRLELKRPIIIAGGEVQP